MEDTLNVGIIGLDTSHATGFGSVLARRDDATVSAVLDDNAVRGDAYVEEFCETHAAQRADRLEGVIDRVDAAMVLTVDWDSHRPLAERFLEAGIPVLVDKPIAGSAGDVEALEEATRDSSAPLFGGSAVPYHPALAPMRTDPGAHDLFIVGYNCPFYYGAHLTDVARAICGSNWRRIEPRPTRATTVVTFGDGSTATLRFDGPTEDQSFGFLDVGEVVRTARIPGNEAELERMYEPFVGAFLEVARGNRTHRDEVFDAANLLLGVQAALEAGETITPDSSALEAVHKDGATFAERYEPPR